MEPSNPSPSGHSFGAISNPEAHPPYQVHQSVNQEICQVRPWVRFWARNLDMIVYVGVFQVFALIVLNAAYHVHAVIGLIAVIVGVLLYVLGLLCIAGGGYLILDAFFMSKTGTTPGKWLLKTTVTHQNGNFLSFMETLGRDLKVLWRGQGLGVPPFSLITPLIAYQRLKQNGITSWDRDGNFKVTHDCIGAGRVWGILVGYLVFSLLMGQYHNMLLSEITNTLKTKPNHFIGRLADDAAQLQNSVL